MELTSVQQSEILRLRQYYPYRIIIGIINKDTKEFMASAVTNMRIPNKLAREGHEVFVCN
uniref:Uncharacterized protein n=1 Tax=viral metagenome TaxID=1070528 RepID=A0A6M3LJR8_9ZZZZ